MKFNPDCVRDIMLYLEENMQYMDVPHMYEMRRISHTTLIEAIQSQYKYTVPDIFHSIEMLEQGDCITLKKITGGHGQVMSFAITGITLKGHNFLDIVRPEKLWTAIKHKTADFGKFAVKTIFQAGSFALTTYMTNPEEFHRIFDMVINQVK